MQVFRPFHADDVDVTVAFRQSPVVDVAPADHGHMLSLLAAARRGRTPETRDRRSAVDNGDTRLRRCSPIVAERHVTYDRYISGFVGGVSVSFRSPTLAILVAVLTVKVNERGDEQGGQQKRQRGVREPQQGRRKSLVCTLVLHRRRRRQRRKHGGRKSRHRRRGHGRRDGGGGGASAQRTC